MSGTPEQRTVLITGSSGLIGSEVATYLSKRGWAVHGIDNNQRAIFFGEEGDTQWRQKELESQLPGYMHHSLDIRDRDAILALIDKLRPAAIVHAAAQPSHDLAAKIPFDDFDTNAIGTLNLLEGARRSVPQAAFVLMSTNKVYGDRPNSIPLRESETRWDFASEYADGILESFSIDQSKHSLFGASKVAADILTQEYGRYFGMNTCCLRGGCLTGPAHSGVQLHGFLSYLVRCNMEKRKYFIYGYKGKQVRDNIHSRDVARFIEAFIEAPRSGEVYNIGGGKANSISIFEAFRKVESLTGVSMLSEYVDESRAGDHICYYSDLSKMKSHYPNWDISISLDDIFKELVDGWRLRLSSQ